MAHLWFSVLHLAYTVECIVLLFLHGNVHLSFYASGFSLTDEKGSQEASCLSC